MIRDYQKICDFGKGKTLLSAFLLSGITSHEEPVRKGTPRGDKIGFPQPKHAAALFVGVTSLSQKEIAERLGLSHRVLLTWHTERDYQTAIQKHRRNFVHLLVDHLAAPQPDPLTQSYLSLFDDIRFYGDDLLENGLGRELEGLEKGLTDARPLMMLLTRLIPFVGNSSRRKFFNKAVKIVTRRYLDNKPPMTEEWRGIMAEALIRMMNVYASEAGT